GIKAARIQAPYSPLINSTWPGLPFQANVLSAVRHATGWLNPHRGARRPVGRHAGPPRRLFGRRAPRCPTGTPVPLRLNALDPGFHGVPAGLAHPERDADGAGV